MRPRLAQLLVVSVLLGVPTFAQSALVTPFPAVNTFYLIGGGGDMFDIVATNAIVIDTFDVRLIPGVAITMEVYAVTGGGSYLPVQATPAAWTLIGSATLASAGFGVPTPLPVPINLLVGAGQTQGIYITSTLNVAATNSGMIFTTGITQGAVWAQDVNLQVLEGNALGYPFGGTFVPYDWNGTVHYHLAANLLVATTSGGGVGDLLLGLTMIAPGANEGYLLVSATATGPVGAGPFLGIYPDGITFALLQEPLNVGDPLHFVVGPTGVFPDQQFVLPAGSLLLGGQTWDAVAAIFGPGFAYLGKSNVQRLIW